MSYEHFLLFDTKASSVTLWEIFYVFAFEEVCASDNTKNGL